MRGAAIWKSALPEFRRTTPQFGGPSRLPPPAAPPELPRALSTDATGSSPARAFSP